MIVRTSGDHAAVLPLVRQAVYALDSEIPVFNVRTMDEVMAQRRSGHRVFGGMFVVFAIVALVMAAVGLYAVTAYSVSQRTQEIGLRLVLGAQPGEVVGPDPDGARLLARQRRVPEVAARGQSSGMGFHPVLLELLLLHRVMELELLPKRRVLAAGEQPVPDPAKQPPHHDVASTF